MQAPAPAGRVAQLLREAAFCQIHVHPDADSVAAAALVARGLARAGVPFQARFRERPDPAALASEADALPVFVGSSPEALEGLPSEPLVLDPQTAEAPCCTALAMPVAEALGAPHPLLGLAGLEASRAGDRGEGLRAAWAAGCEPGPVPALGPAPLVEALAASVDPFLPGLGGRARVAKRFLDEAGVGLGLAASDLAPEHAARLTDALALHLLARGADAAAVHALLAPDLRGAVPGGSSRGLARLLQAACEAGEPGLAFALALGDVRGEAQALGLEEARDQRLLHALLKLEGDGIAQRLLPAEPDLAGALAWAASVSLAGGEPVLVSSIVHGAARLHVAAPRASPSHLARLAVEAGEAVEGWGWGRGGQAVIHAPAESLKALEERLRKGLVA